MNEQNWESSPLNSQSKRDLIISKGWFQAAILVFVFGFFVLGLLAYWTYTEKPPVPAEVVNSNGTVLFTGRDITAGQQVFLRNGLMEYGSVLGHGAYLGPDFTTDYLRRASGIVRETHGGSGSGQSEALTINDFKTNRYQSETGRLIYSAGQEKAFTVLQEHYYRFFSEPTTRFGLRPSAISSREDIRQLTAYFSCSITVIPTTGRRNRQWPTSPPPT